MLERTNYSTGAPWEARVGYSRAVRVGNIIEVTGTVAVDDQGQPMAVGDAYSQTRIILEKLKTCSTAPGPPSAMWCVPAFL
jgi:enamine deaminase RidA (YjgF/YER057c/UK114 family)